MGIRTEDCIACGQCVEVCEFKALYFVSTHGYAQVKFDPKKCVQCGDCLKVDCPGDCIF